MKRAVYALAATLLALPLMATAERNPSGQAEAGRPRPLMLEAGPLSVTVSARAQAQGAFYAGQDSLLSAGDAAENAGFRLRRARLGMEASVYRMRVGVEIDLLESSGSALHEAYVGYDSPYAFAIAGVVKVPFSRSALISSEVLQMAERPIGVTAIAPAQQLGVTFGGKAWGDKIRLMVGLFNGMTRGQTFAGGWDRINPKLGNRFGGLATAVRLDFEPLGLLGGAISDLNAQKSVRLGIGGGFLYNAGDTVTTTGFSGDLALKAYGASLLGEFIQTESKPDTQPTQNISLLGNVTMRTALAQVGYAIPLSAQDAAIEIAARWELVDENTAVDDAGDYMMMGATVSGYVLEGAAKLQLQYLHRLESNGPSLQNDSLILSAEGRF